MAYALECINCKFEKEAGSIQDALDVVDDHRTEYGDHHFVEFERVQE